jgi:hypothetical protein
MLKINYKMINVIDESYYVCTAQNSVGTGQSSQTFLDVVGSKL